MCSGTLITFVICFKVLILEPNRVYLPSYAQVNEDGDEQVKLFFVTSGYSVLGKIKMKGCYLVHQNLISSEPL